ncbi:MAG: DUF4402 domain-containing protein [Bacteroidales bacterium]
MKKFKKLISFAVIFAGISTAAFAQTATATSNAAAVIIAPLSITNTAGLHFGTIMRSATAGTVTITTDGTRSSLGGVTLSALAPLHSAATFDLEGESGNEVLITLPVSTTITNGTQTMTVDNFVSDPDDANPVTLTGAATVLRVGATLNVDADQPSGTYNGTFNVRVDYN